MVKASKAVLKYMNSPYGLSFTEAKKMAKRKRSKKKSKTNTPAVRHLRYLIGTTGTGVESFYIDLAHDLSLVNRRLYRQGKHYFVSKMTVRHEAASPAAIAVSAAPTSWVVEAAWKKAFRLWNQMRKGHGGAPGSGLPRGVTPATWADFKVYLDNGHRTGSVVHPSDNGGNVVSLTDSEWVYARYISPDATAASDEFTAHLLGADVGAAGAFTSVGIVQGYEDSRRTVQEDDSGDTIGTDTWMVNLFDDGTTLDEIAADLKADGDLPPYRISKYCGGDTNMVLPLVQQARALIPYATPGGEAPSSIMGGVHAPCGLLQIQCTSDTENDNFELILEVSAGDYKGVKALAM